MTYIASKCKKIDLGCERLTHLDIAVGHLCCVRGGIRIFGFAVLAIFLDRFFDFLCQKTSVSRFWCSLQFADFPFSPRWEAREGTARRRVLLSTEHCQSFFINATSKLVTKSQATRDWLIQHSNRISKLSGLSSQMEMLDYGFLMKLSRAIAFCDCKIAIL